MTTKAARSGKKNYQNWSQYNWDLRTMQRLFAGLGQIFPGIEEPTQAFDAVIVEAMGECRTFETKLKEELAKLETNPDQTEEDLAELAVGCLARYLAGRLHRMPKVKDRIGLGKTPKAMIAKTVLVPFEIWDRLQYALLPGETDEDWAERGLKLLVEERVANRKGKTERSRR